MKCGGLEKRFRQENLAGLQNVKSDESVWDFPLPAAGPDDEVRARALNERPRIREPVLSIG